MSLADLINQVTADQRLRLALARGALLEGGSISGPWPCHFDVTGQSCGPYQINLPAHPDVSASQAVDPGFSLGYMLPRYQSCVNKFDWSNPEQASAQTVQCAEIPAAPYSADQRSQTWQEALGLLGNPATGGAQLMSSPIGTNQGGGCTFGWTLPDGSCLLPGGSGEGPPNPVDGAMSLLAGITTNFTDPNTWIRIALVVGGLAVAIVGVSAMLGGSTPAVVPV